MSFMQMFGAHAAQKGFDSLHEGAGLGDWLAEKRRKDAAHDAREAYDYQERTGIMSRVEGAKAAGLHPLAALGYQSAGTPATYIPGDSGGGGGALSNYRGASPVDQDMRQAQLRLINAQADDAEARAQASRAALATQPGQPPVRMPTDPANRMPGQPNGLRPGITVKPDEVTAGMRGLTAGTHQAATDFRIPGGQTWSLPSSNAAASLEDMGLLKYYLLYLSNKDRLTKFLSEDIPWSIGLDPRKGKFLSNQITNKKRSGGATGSW